MLLFLYPDVVHILLSWMGRGSDRGIASEKFQDTHVRKCHPWCDLGYSFWDLVETFECGLNNIST